jgi:hypothetical protein
VFVDGSFQVVVAGFIDAQGQSVGIEHIDSGNLGTACDR